MFALCANMQWNHLPSPGGIYEQDPQLIDDFQFIFSEINKREQDEMEKQERESKKLRASQPSRSRYSRS